MSSLLNQNITNLQVLLEKVNNLPEQVILPDLGDTAAQSYDIALGKVLYDDKGNPVTGTLVEDKEGNNIIASGDTKMSVGALFVMEGTYYASKIGDNTVGCILRPGVNMVVRTPAENMGDAKPEDVLIGKTFTSANGVKISGTIATKSSQDIAINEGVVTVPIGYYASQATVAIPTETKTITENGTYTPSSGKYFSSVTVNTPVGYKSGDVVKAASISLSLGTSYISVSVTYGTSIVNTNGTLSLGDSTTVNVSSASDLDVIKGKYVRISSTIYYIPTDASITQTGTTYNKSYTSDKANPVFVIA